MSINQHFGLATVVVRDYDEAIDFYVNVLGFELLEDRELPEQRKRWVVVTPARTKGPGLVLARAVGEKQESRIGNQTGGRVAFFLYTDDFWGKYREFREKGVEFVREPKEERYGVVAVFRDLYGNLWDLLQPVDAGTA